MSDLSIKRPVGLAAGAVCAAVGLSAAAGTVASLLADRALWFMLGFEVITLVAAVFGVLVALGRFRAGPGLALLCVMGTVAVGSLLSDQSAKLANPLSGPVLRTIGEWQITLFFVLREGCAALIGVCAAWIVLSRRPKESIGSLVRGAAFAIGLCAVLGATWALRSRAAALGTLAQTLGGLLIACVALGLLAGAIHFTIRAFEFGRIGDDRPGGNSRTA